MTKNDQKKLEIMRALVTAREAHTNKLKQIEQTLKNPLLSPKARDKIERLKRALIANHEAALAGRLRLHLLDGR